MYLRTTSQDLQREFGAVLHESDSAKLAQEFAYLGFFDAVWKSSEDSLMVDSGKRTLIHAIVSITDSVTVREDVNRAYAVSWIDSYVRNILFDYSESGYPYTIVEPSFSRTDSGTVLTLEITPGMRIDTVVPQYIVSGTLRPWLLDRPLKDAFSGTYRYSSTDTALRRLRSKKYIHSVNAGKPIQKDSDNRSHATIPLFIEARRTVLFEGGIAFQTYPEKSLTGDGEFSVLNVLGFGESFSFRYAVEDDYHNIEALLSIPYLAGLPLGFHFGAHVELADSGYGFARLQGEVEYDLKDVWSARFGGEWYELSALGLSDESGKTDQRKVYGGIVLTLNRTALEFERRVRDWRIDLEAKSGFLHENKETVPKGEVTASVGSHVPFGASRFAYNGQVTVGLIAVQQPAELHDAELFRLGGAASVRGYSEQEYPALGMGLMRNELRFYFSRFGALYLLGDYGAGVRESYKSEEIFHLFGYGIGVTVPFASVRFSLEWARHLHEPMGPGRIHFRLGNR